MITYLIFGFFHGPVLKFVLNLPDKSRTDPFLKLVCWSIEVEYLDDLADPELVTHLTNTNNIFFAFSCLKHET